MHKYPAARKQERDMAVQADQVVVELVARVDKAEADIRRYGTSFDRTMDGIGAAATKTERLVAAAGRGIAAGLAGVSITALAQSFLSMADRSKQLQAQLRLATREFGSFGQAQTDVQRISAATRSSLEATTDLYGAFIRNGSQLGATQDEAARATETFSKVLKIGGASAAEASSATLQFSQALASGALRGDEFNSIAEASPRILKLLADALGVPQGALRKLAEEGKLTSEVLFDALTNTKFTNGIDAEFRELPVTFDEAMQRVEDAAITVFGAFDRGGEFSTMLANFVTDGTGGFADLEASAEEFGINARAFLEGLDGALDPFFASADSGFDGLGDRVASFAATTRKEFLGILGLVDSATGALADRANNSALTGWMFRGGARGTNLRGDFLEGESDTQNRLRRDRLYNRAGAGATVSFMESAFREAQGAQRRGSGASSAAGKKKAGSARTPRSPLDPQAFERAEDNLNDAILRAKQDQATSAAERARIEIERINGDAESFAAEVQASKKFTEEQKAKLVALSGQRAAIQVAKIAAEERARVEQEDLELRIDDLRTQQDVLRAQEQLARTNGERRDIGLRIVALQIEEERLALERVLADRDATDAAKEAARRRLGALDQIAAADDEGVRRNTMGPLESYFDRIPQTAEEINEAIEGIAVGGLRDLEDGFARAATKALGLKGALGDIVGEFIRLGVQRGFLALFGGSAGGGGGIGGLISSIGSIFGGSPTGRAGGGPVSAGQFYRVNERSSPGNVEGFRPAGSGTVIPLGQMKAATAGGSQNGTIRLVVEEAPGFATRVASISTDRAVEVVRVSAPTIIDASVNETFRRGNRPGL